MNGGEQDHRSGRIVINFQKLEEVHGWWKRYAVEERHLRMTIYTTPNVISHHSNIIVNNITS